MLSPMLTYELCRIIHLERLAKAEKERLVQMFRATSTPHRKQWSYRFTLGWLRTPKAAAIKSG